MGTPKITGFIIALILISFFAAIFALAISSYQENYNVVLNETDVSTYNNLDELSTLSQEIQNKTDIEERSGVLDIIGSYFTSGYKALKLTAKSFNIFDSMGNQAIKDAKLGEVGSYLRVTLISIVIILIFIGIIISRLVKRQL